MEPTKSKRETGNVVVVIGAVQAAAAAGGYEEVAYSEIGGGDADGEAEGVAEAADLDDVDPEEEDLDADAAESGEAAGGDVTGDCGAVAELVGALEGEAAAAIEVGGEGAGGAVEIVPEGTLREQPRRESVRSQHLVRRQTLNVGGETEAEAV